MTTTEDRPPRLRTVLRGLQAALDEASGQQMAHIAEHGCRPGHGDCQAGAYWACQVADAQGALGMTRFASEGD